jgi:hypothetical protein
MVYAIDIDGTIALTNGTDYEHATPIRERIAFINKLYQDGHNITYYTARGSLSKDPVRQKEIGELTERQLKEWGALYSELDTSKRFFELLIDDRAINADQFFDIVEKIA